MGGSPGPRLASDCTSRLLDLRAPSAAQRDGRRADDSCGFTKTGSANNGDGVNPLLSRARLTDNDGPTQTVPLRSGSPAIDAIPVADCTDQASPPNRLVPTSADFLVLMPENCSATSALTTCR